MHDLEARVDSVIHGILAGAIVVTLAGLCVLGFEAIASPHQQTVVTTEEP